MNSHIDSECLNSLEGILINKLHKLDELKRTRDTILKQLQDNCPSYLEYMLVKQQYESFLEGIDYKCVLFKYRQKELRVKYDEFSQKYVNELKKQSLLYQQWISLQHEVTIINLDILDIKKRYD